MKYCIACALLLLVTACMHHREEENHQRFADEIVQTLGTNGEACMTEAGQTYCVSASRERPTPVAVGDNLEPGQDLWLCQQQPNGGLIGCEPLAADSLHCFGEPEAGGGCRCTGVDACLAMAGDKSCGNGSCGDCTGGAQCCCEY